MIFNVSESETLLIKILLIMMILDYLSGIANAIYNKKVNSKVGYKGIVQKFTYIIIITLSLLIDTLINDNGAISSLILYFLIGNDGISILENIGGTGVKLPKKLKAVFEQLKKDE